MDNNFAVDSTEDSIIFYHEWLDVADYELKLLILTSILAENNLAYRGNLTNMCEWLGVKQNANNNSNIKRAIESLENKGLIFYKLDGRIYTITISERGMKDKKIVRIRKAWVSAFKKYNKDGNNNRIDKNISIDWIKILRVFVYLYSKKMNKPIKIEDIAMDLNVSKTTASNAIKAIQSCELCGIRMYKNTIRNCVMKDGDPTYYNVGTDMGFIIIFDE